MKTYAVHSLFAVYAQALRGIPNGIEDVGIETTGQQLDLDEDTIRELQQLADAHEVKDVEGRYRDYVEAAITTTTKLAQRRARTRVLAQILTKT